VLGNEGAGIVEEAGDTGMAVGSRVMFTGPYGVRESGAWQEWLLVRPEHLAAVPETISDVVAASLPVAYLTAQITLALAGFAAGKTVLASRHRRVGRQCNLSARAGTRRRQSYINSRQHREGREGTRAWLRGCH
jgi:hypothetical protein